MRLRYLLVAMLVTWTAETSSNENPEIVMAPGCEITARTSAGTITIRAGEVRRGYGTQTVKTPRGPVTRPIPDRYPRTYCWGRCERSVDLEPRTVRWHGSLGINFPGTGFHWAECEGVARAVVEEGQLHFETLDEALAWTKAREPKMAYVYRNDGLVIGWGTQIPDRKEMTVEVWQLLIAGKKPTSLPGASDAGVTMTCTQLGMS